MPGRFEVFLKGGIYHLFNKTIEGKKVFIDSTSCSRFLDIVHYYKSSMVKISYSRFKRLPLTIQHKLNKKNNLKKNLKVNLLSYCLMPTHFHLLVQQVGDKPVSRFIGDIVNAFTRYFNLKHNRKGPLFIPRFKSVRITTDEQLWHVSRYIHLNPYTSEVVRNIADCDSYPWSSLGEYISSKMGKGICEKNMILSFFKNSTSYQSFVKDNADYQRRLELIKHVMKW